MNLKFSGSRARQAGFTLVEASVAAGLGVMVLGVLAAITVYSSRTFSAMSNYVDLDVHSRNALDLIGREARQATAVLDWQTNGTVNYLIFTNAIAISSLKLTYYRNVGLLTYKKTGQAEKVILTGCERWVAGLYTRAPSVDSTNITFYAATNLSSCKLVNMSWKCSRTIMGSKLNTESVQTAQIVLRNKIN